jgi:hypothetical protein
MYLHNNFIGNALVLSKVKEEVQNAFYTNLSGKEVDQRIISKMVGGNIVDEYYGFQKGKVLSTSSRIY